MRRDDFCFLSNTNSGFKNVEGHPCMKFDEIRSKTQTLSWTKDEIHGNRKSMRMRNNDYLWHCILADEYSKFGANLIKIDSARTVTVNVIRQKTGQADTRTQ